MSIKEIFSKIDKPFITVLEGWFELNANSDVSEIALLKSKSQSFLDESDKF